MILALLSIHRPRGVNQEAWDSWRPRGVSNLWSFSLWQTPEELDDSDFETEDFDVRSRTSVQTEDDQLIAGQSARVRNQLILFC